MLALFFAPPTELILCGTHTHAVVVNRRLCNAKLNIALLILGFRFRRRSQKASRFYCGTGDAANVWKKLLWSAAFTIFSRIATLIAQHTHCSPLAFRSFYSFLWYLPNISFSHMLLVLQNRAFPCIEVVCLASARARTDTRSWNHRKKPLIATHKKGKPNTKTAKINTQ